MSDFKYLSIDNVLAKFSRDTGLKANELDMIEWTGEALEAINAPTQYDEAVAIIEIKNHQAELPNHLHVIIQVAKNTCFTPENKECVLPEAIIEQTQEEGLPVPLDCNGQPLTDYDLAYYRPYYDYKAEYIDFPRNHHSGCYVPVRLATHTFFNSLVCSFPDEIYNECQDEYTIINKEIIRTSFKEGSIAISYLKQKLDCNGYPMIPDNYSYRTAITKYMAMKITEREFYSNVQGAGGKLQYAEQQWQWYCRQAANQAMIPKGIDAYQNIMDQRNYLLPKTNSYYGFFGKLANPERRTYNDPNSRNFRRNGNSQTNI